MGLKWLKKWVLTHFDPLLDPKTRFLPTFGPILGVDKTHLKPTLNKLFSKKGPEAALTQHKYVWKPVDPVVADPVRHDNDKINNIQTYTEIPY